MIGQGHSPTAQDCDFCQHLIIHCPRAGPGPVVPRALTGPGSGQDFDALTRLS